jgi:hypothetical protein
VLAHNDCRHRIGYTNVQAKRTLPWLWRTAVKSSRPNENISSAYSRTVCPVSVSINLRVVRAKSGRPQRVFELLELRTDARLGDVQNFTGLSQAAFLGNGPEIKQMMVIKALGVIRFNGILYSILRIINSV